MARVDRTFSAPDIVRFYSQNLTRAEQDIVRCFFFIGELDARKKKKGFELISRFLIQLLKFSPAGFILDVIDDIISILEDPVDVKDCLDKLTKL